MSFLCSAQFDPEFPAFWEYLHKHWTNFLHWQNVLEISSYCHAISLLWETPSRGLGGAKINRWGIQHPFGHNDLTLQTHSLRCNLWIVWLSLAYRTPQSSTLSPMATAGGYCAGNHHDPPVSINNQLALYYLHQSYWWDWRATGLEDVMRDVLL